MPLTLTLLACLALYAQSGKMVSEIMKVEDKMKQNHEAMEGKMKQNHEHMEAKVDHVESKVGEMATALSEVKALLNLLLEAQKHASPE